MDAHYLAEVSAQRFTSKDFRYGPVRISLL
jgi:hypothetical protein